MPEPSHPDIKNTLPSNNFAVNAVNSRQVFPWLRMFDLFWISVDLQKLLLAAVAVLLFSAGNWCIQRLPFATQEALPITSEVVIEEAAETDGGTWPWQQFQQSGGTPLNNSRSWQLVLSPAEAVARPGQVLFQSAATWPQLALAWTQLLWTLAVWALFGGAITRIAAVQIGADRRVNPLDALKFSARRFLSYYSAPLLPLAGVGICWGLCLLGGLIGRIPGAGPWIVGLFWGLALLLGLFMALALIGAVAGWPLMFTTISVEGSDAPDGLSRSYGFVFTKPWYYLFLLAIAGLLGTVLSFVISALADLSAYFAIWAVSWGLGAAAPAENPLATVWNGLLATLVVAFMHSYFWSAVTMIYFLLRRSVDANDFSDVYLEDEQHDDLLLFEKENE